MDWHSRRDSLGYGTQENDAAIPQVWRVVCKKLGLDADWTVLGNPERDASEPMVLSEKKSCSMVHSRVYIFNRRKAEKEIPE